MKKLFSTCLMAMAAVSSVFAAEWPFTVSPDPSVPLTSALKEVNLLMPEGSDVEFTSVNDASAIYVTLEGETYRRTAPDVIDGSMLNIFIMGDGIDVPGNYEVVIGAGAISMNNVPTDEDIVINYTFEGGGAPSNEFLNPTYPEANTVISQIDSFWIENKTGYNLSLENAEGIYLAVDFEKAYELEINCFDYGFEGYVIGADGYITEITEPGEYQLIIEPRSLALVNPEDAEDINYIDDAIYFTYIVGTPEVDFSNFPLDFYPAPGSKVGALEFIYIEPNQELGFTGINCLEEPSYVMGICNADQEFFDFTAEYDDTFVRITLNEPITTAGEYSLMIMPYSIAAVSEEGEYYIDEMVTVPFTVVGTVANPYDVPFKVVEPNAAVVDAVYYVELDLDYESGYTEFVVNDYSGIYFTKDGNYYMPGSPEAYGNSLYVDAIPYITTSGEYALVIEKGAISWKNDTETVTNPEEYVFSFTVEGSDAGDIPFTVTPEDGATVGSLSSITVTFDEEYYDTMIDPYGIYFVNVADYDNAALISVEQVDDHTWVLNLTDENGVPTTITEDGMYQLAFDTYSIGCESDTRFYINEGPLMYTYTVDSSSVGINSVSSERVVEGVYNMLGVKVADTTENLPAGLYIVNGKKVIVK